MARQLHTAVARGAPTDLNGVALTELACNASDKEKVARARRLLILFRNVGATPRVVTVNNGAPGASDTTFTVAADGDPGALVSVYVSDRWRQRSGTYINTITFEAAHADIVASIVDET